MDDTKDGSAEGTRQAFQVAYHGDNPNDHSIDIEALVPALQGFDRLVRQSNAILNGDRSRMRVVVASDFEHKCFHINFEVIQHAYEVAKTLLGDDHVKTAKDLLQLIGVIRSATGTTSLLDFLKWKKNKQVETVKPTEPSKPDAPQTNVTIQIIGGDGNTINVHPDVIRLAGDPRVLDAVKDTFAPIEMHEATRVEFREDDQPVSSIGRDDVRDIVLATDATELVKNGSDDAATKTFITTLYVYSPVFDERAKRWRFLYDRDKHVYFDISETSIAADAMKRGGSFRDDRYRVRIELTPPTKPDGDPHLKITEVLEFTPAPQQGNLPLPTSGRKRFVAEKPAKKASAKKGLKGKPRKP
jgi:hypothetical protein